MTVSLEDTAAELIQLFHSIGTLNAVNLVSASGTAVTIPEPSVAANSVIVLTEATVAITLPPPVTGQRLSVFPAQDATGGRLVDWATTDGVILWAGPNTAPTLQTAALAVDQINFTCPVGGDYWIGSNAAGSAGGGSGNAFTSVVVSAAGAYTYTQGSPNAIFMAGSAQSLVVDDGTMDGTQLRIINASSSSFPVTISALDPINNGNDINPGTSVGLLWSTDAGAWTIDSEYFAYNGYFAATSSTPYVPISGIASFIAASNPGSTVTVDASATPVPGESITIANVDSTGTTTATFAPTSTTVAYPDAASWTYDEITSAYVPVIVPGGGGGGVPWTVVAANHASSPYAPVSGANTWFVCDVTAGNVEIDTSASPVNGEIIRITAATGTHLAFFSPTSAEIFTGGTGNVITMEFQYDAATSAYIPVDGNPSIGGTGLVSAGGSVASLDSSGNARNTIDDGTGNATIAKDFTVTGNVDGPSFSASSINEVMTANNVLDSGVGAATFTGEFRLTGLPTSDPHVEYQLWSNLGIVTVSAG
jgi:hypothetical protein